MWRFTVTVSRLPASRRFGVSYWGHLGHSGALVGALVGILPRVGTFGGVLFWGPSSSWVGGPLWGVHTIWGPLGPLWALGFWVSGASGGAFGTELGSGCVTLRSRRSDRFGSIVGPSVRMAMGQGWLDRAPAWARECPAWFVGRVCWHG